MESKIQKLIEVLRLFEHSEFTELHLEADGTRIDLSKDGDFAFPTGPPAGELSKHPVTRATATPTIAGAQRIERVGLPSAESLAGPLVLAQSGASAPKSAPPTELGLMAIRSPTLGNFYRAPSPGEPSFVEVGDRVSEHDTVCLIECMKLFNTIEAGCDGIVVSIAVENAQMVEFGQALMYVHPD